METRCLFCCPAIGFAPPPVAAPARTAQADRRHRDGATTPAHEGRAPPRPPWVGARPIPRFNPSRADVLLFARNAADPPKGATGRHRGKLFSRKVERN
ncbi:MAG: hypothetical protein D6781_12230 [Verrucomicrobia bacterium]|nr:MAG: hypothetical protein D6781_12230 [Verrucomicrobiota bacterium]